MSAAPCSLCPTLCQLSCIIAGLRVLAAPSQAWAPSPSHPRPCTRRLPPPSRRVYDGTWRGPNGNWAYFFHMLHLAGCEFPLSEHRQWLGVTQMPQGSGLEAVRTRPPLKRRLLLGMGAAQVRWAPPLGLGWASACERPLPQPPAQAADVCMFWRMCLGLCLSDPKDPLRGRHQSPRAIEHAACVPTLSLAI